MSEIREDLHYTREHEWIRMEGNEGTVGITDHAQEELTDIVFVELPELDRKVNKGDVIGAVESVKTVADMYSPITGKIIEVNEELEDNPQYINESPYEDGWIVKIKVDNESELNQLLDSDEYEDLLKGLD